MSYIKYWVTLILHCFLPLIPQESLIPALLNNIIYTSSVQHILHIAIKYSADIITQTQWLEDVINSLDLTSTLGWGATVKKERVGHN